MSCIGFLFLLTDSVDNFVGYSLKIVQNGLNKPPVMRAEKMGVAKNNSNSKAYKHAQMSIALQKFFFRNDAFVYK